jgi:4-amino-4-deoxy-L-arabinose transferase-like glycosyltransferase
MTDLAAGERAAAGRVEIADRERRKTGILAWALVASVTAGIVAGVVLRIARLGDKVLSFDEAYTLATAQRSFARMLDIFQFEANGTLYAVLLWPLLRISESEEAIRLLALLAGIATIPAVYWTGRALTDRRAALIAAAFVALSPAMIGWSVYGRAYAFGILFAVLSFGCLVRALDEPERGATWRWVYVACVLATAYSSVLAAITLAPVHFAVLAWRARGTRTLRAWAGPALGLLAGLVPLGVILVLESTYRDPLAWLWEPDLALVRRVGGELTAGPAYFGDAGAGLTGAIVLTLAAILVAGLVLSRRRRSVPSWQTTMLLGWALFPPALLLVASEIRPTFWGRYLGIVVPAVALLIAALLVRLPRALGAFYGVGLGALLLTASLVAWPPFNDFRGSAGWIEARRSAEDPLVVYPIEQLPALAYYGESLRIEGDVPVEEWDDTRLPPGVHGFRRDYDWGDSPVGPPSADELSHLASETGALTMLVYPNLAGGIDTSRAEASGCDVEWATFKGLSVMSLSSCPAGD